VTRWIVQRINDMRTARRELINRLSSSWWKLSRRDHNPTYGEPGTWACMPTSRSIAFAAEIFERFSNIWRSSSARFRARIPRTGAGLELRVVGDTTRELKSFEKHPSQDSLALAFCCNGHDGPVADFEIDPGAALALEVDELE
jgi:hypothetical protein